MKIDDELMFGGIPLMSAMEKIKNVLFNNDIKDQELHFLLDTSRYGTYIALYDKKEINYCFYRAVIIIIARCGWAVQTMPHKYSLVFNKYKTLKMVTCFEYVDFITTVIEKYDKN